jgi:hypothetical protein
MPSQGVPVALDPVMPEEDGLILRDRARRADDRVELAQCAADELVRVLIRLFSYLQGLSELSNVPADL